MGWKTSNENCLPSLSHQFISMVPKKLKIRTIIAPMVLTFLMGALLINIRDTAYQTLHTTQRLWKACDGAEACSDRESVALDDIPLRKVYDELIKTGLGRRGGVKMNITLLSAFEHPDQIYVMMMSRDKYGDTIYCRYFDHQQKEIGPAFKTVVFPEFTANCLRREGAKYISLTDSANGSYEFSVPIIDRTQNLTPHYFSACLASLYGSTPKWLLLAEFIEHHKIHGVTHFYIYVREIDEYSRKLLEDYVRTGDAEIIVLYDRFERETEEWHSIQLQECLTRARGHSHWVALIDLDERLVTTEYNGTLSDYLRNISDPTIAEISFRHRWILRNETPPEKYIDQNQVVEFMPTLRYHNTSHVGPPGHTAKYIVDPKKTMIAGVHIADMFFDDYKRYFMKPEEAVIRHYRDVHADKWGKIWLKGVEDFGEFSMTDYPKAHIKTLIENVQRRLHHVYGGLR